MLQGGCKLPEVRVLHFKFETAFTNRSHYFQKLKNHYTICSP